MKVDGALGASLPLAGTSADRWEGLGLVQGWFGIGKTGWLFRGKTWQFGSCNLCDIQGVLCGVMKVALLSSEACSVL